VIGGVSVFELTLPYADALYITRVEDNFHCDRFFPYFGHNFHRIWHSEPQFEDELQYQYEQWVSNE
jgi:dihydrofolate reductase